MTWIVDFVYIPAHTGAMASTPESKVKARVVSLLKARGVYYFFPATHGMGRSGVPDIICCVASRFVAVECKAGGKKPTALQQLEIAQIQKAGGVALVINEANMADLLSVLEEIQNV